MKKIVISTLAVLVACPAFAGMSNGDSYGTSKWQLFGLDPYIALRGGMSYNNLNYKMPGADKKSMTDWIYQGRAALGLEICDTVRSEIEWSIFSKAKDTRDFGMPVSVEVESKLQTLLYNTYLELGDYQIVRPFVGLGAGVAFSDVKRKVPGFDDHSESKTRFSAMGTLGMTFEWNIFAVDIAARYTYVDVNSGLHNFGGDIGVRFMF